MKSQSPITESPTPGRPVSMVGAVDMGSKNFKFVIGQKLDGTLTTELIGKERLNLGREVTENHGLIGAEKMAQIEQTLSRFVHFCRERGVPEVLAIATSAVRNARNHQRVIDLARATGLTLNIADGEREGEVGYFAATGGASNKLVSDSGSKSIQVAWGVDGEVLSRSIPVGYELAYESFVKDETTLNASEIKFRRFLDGNFSELPGNTDQYFALAANTVTSFVTGEDRQGPQRTLNGDALRQKISELRALSTSQYQDLKSSLPGAEKILPGLIFLDYMMERGGHGQAMISQNELPVGLIVEYFLKRERLELPPAKETPPSPDQ